MWGVAVESQSDPEDERVSQPDFVRAGLLFYGAMAVVAVIWRSGVYRESIFFLSADASLSVRFLRWDLLLGISLGLGIVAFSNLVTRRTDWGDHLARSMGEALGPISTPNAVLLAFASGLAEEMFFRGAMQPRFGFVATSLIFGAVHFVPRREFLPWTGFALVVGGLLGGLFLYTGNLLAPVLAHFVVNAVNLPMLVHKYGPRTG